MLKRKIIIQIVLLSIVVTFSVALFKGGVFPAYVYHIYYLANPPKDLYNHLVSDDSFHFSEKGFFKKYTIEPKYKELYHLGVKFNYPGVDSKYRFTGVLQFKILCDDKPVFVKEINSIRSAWYFSNDMQKFKDMSFVSFELPLCVKNTTKVYLIVLEPDVLLPTDTQLYIAVSAVP